MDAGLLELLEAIEAVQGVVDVINENTSDSSLPQELLDFIGLFTDDEANTDEEQYFEEFTIEFDDIGAKLDTTNQILGSIFILMCLTIVTTVIVKTFFTGW